MHDHIKEQTVVGFSLAVLVAIIGFSISIFSPFGALAFLVGALFFAVLVVKPEWGVYGLAALFPFTNWFWTSPSFLPFSVYAPYVDMIGLVLVGAWFLRLLFHWIFEDYRIRLRDYPGFLLFAAFVIAQLFSIQNAYAPLTSLKFVLRPIIFVYLVYLVVPFHVITSKQVLKRVVGIVVAVSAVIAGSGVASFWLEKQVGFPRLKPLGLFGVYPMGTNHNLLAETLVTAAPFAFVLALWNKRLRLQKVYVLLGLAMVAVALATFSRAAWIAVALQGIVGVLVLLTKPHYKKMARSIVIVALLASIPLLVVFSQFLNTDIVSDSNTNRLMMLDTGLYALEKNVWFGQGPGMFIDFLGFNSDYTRLFGTPLDAHGLIIKLMTEAGVVGIVLMYGLLSYFLWRIGRTVIAATDDKTMLVLLSFLLVIVGTIVFQQFNTSYYTGKFWFPLGVSLVAVKLLGEHPKKGNADKLKAN